MVLLYIDPGTGSMLFTILIGMIAAAFYAIRLFFIKIKFWLSGGKIQQNTSKIPFVIFSDHKRYWNIFKPILDEFEKRGQEVVYMTLSADDAALEEQYTHVKTEFIGEGNKGFAKLNLLKANILLSTTPGLEVYQWKRSKDVDYYVHIPHAASDITVYRMFGIDYYDAILLSGEYQKEDIRQLEALRNLPAKDIELVGVPYMDVMSERMQEVTKVNCESKTVLLAPSWGPSAILTIYGEKMIEAILKTEHNLIIRPHPQSFISEKKLIDDLMKKYPESDRVKWNRDTDNFECLNSADIMISDFSGVIFDFSLIFDKPIIYTNPNFDVSVYDAWWLNKPLWTASILPDLGRELSEENFDDLSNLIDTCMNDLRYARGRERARRETWCYQGEGAKNVVDYLMEKYEKVQKEND